MEVKKLKRYIAVLGCFVVISCMVYICHRISVSPTAEPSEQIVDAIKKKYHHDEIHINLFNEDLLNTFGVLGFIDTKSNMVAVAIFEKLENSSFRLMKCLFPENNMVKRAADIYVKYADFELSTPPSYNTSSVDVVRYLIILSKNPNLHQIVVSYDGIVDSYDVSVTPSIIMVPMPTSWSEYIYQFYDENGAIIY